MVHPSAPKSAAISVGQQSRLVTCTADPLSLTAAVAQGVPLELSGKVRWACISLMLLRVGLLIKPRAVRARALMVLRLGALPCIKTATIYSAVLVSTPLSAATDGNHVYRAAWVWQDCNGGWGISCGLLSRRPCLNSQNCLLGCGNWL